MTTIIQIGNSDNKLSQLQWASFFNLVDEEVQRRAEKIHFSGTSLPNVGWQNAAWIFEIGAQNKEGLKKALVELCEIFSQDSIAMTEGNTYFLSKRG